MRKSVETIFRTQNVTLHRDRPTVHYKHSLQAFI